MLSGIGSGIVNNNLSWITSLHHDNVNVWKVLPTSTENGMGDLRLATHPTLFLSNPGSSRLQFPCLW